MPGVPRARRRACGRRGSMVQRRRCSAARSDGSAGCGGGAVAGATMCAAGGAGGCAAAPAQLACLIQKSSPLTTENAQVSGRDCSQPSPGEASQLTSRQQRGRHCLGPQGGSRVMQLCLAAAVAVAALLLGPTLTHATEINSAVSIFGPWDYELRADGTSRCTDMVKRTAELGVNSRTMFLPTLFWVSKHPEDFFETNSVRLQSQCIPLIRRHLPIMPATGESCRWGGAPSTEC